MATRITDLFGWLTGTYGGFGLMAIAVADSSFLTLPEANDVLIVLLSAGKDWGEMAYYVTMTTIGSLVGCTLLYTAGRKGGRPLLQRRFSRKSLSRVEGLLGRYGTLTLFVPSLLPPPCPFKVFVLTAGVFGLRLPAFVGVVALGRALRYSLWGVLAVLYGDRITAFMQDNLPAVGVLLLSLFALFLGALVFRACQRRRSGAEG